MNKIIEKSTRNDTILQCVNVEMFGCDGSWLTTVLKCLQFIEIVNCLKIITVQFNQNVYATKS